MFGWLRKEKRAGIEDPRVPISTPNILAFLGLGNESAAGEHVSIATALGVPAVWAAVNFLSGTLAGLPLLLYRRTGEGRERVNNSLSAILHDAPNEEMSSFEWRKYLFDQVFTGGRSVSFIERNAAGSVINIWPLDPDHVRVRMVRGRKLYDHSDGFSSATFEAREVLDIPFMLDRDRVCHRSPILTNAHAIGHAQAAQKYASRFFAGGGVPAFAVEGPFQSAAAMQRASDDLASAMKKGAKENRLALALPSGHTIKTIGTDPEKSQLVETQRFQIEQIARIYSMPPTFLQDLTHGTFSNTEQQDLHFVKHTVKRWVEQFEQELNLKLFGRSRGNRFVEFELDGLLRGDFKTRMDGMAQGIQNGILMPNEARRRMNLPDQTGGDQLFIQGATVPINQAATPGETDGE